MKPFWNGGFNQRATQPLLRNGWVDFSQGKKQACQVAQVSQAKWLIRPALTIIRFRSIKQKLSVQKARPILKLQIENTKFAATINLTCVSPLILYEINKKYKGYK